MTSETENASQTTVVPIADRLTRLPGLPRCQIWCCLGVRTHYGTGGNMI